MHPRFARRRSTGSAMVRIVMASLLLSGAAFADGSNELGTTHALSATTQIRIDLADFSERISFTGTGTLTLSDPFNPSAALTINAGETGSFDNTGFEFPTTVTAVLSEDQPVGAAWDITVLDEGDGALQGRLWSTGWVLVAPTESQSDALGGSVYARVPVQLGIDGQPGTDTIYEIRYSGLSGGTDIIVGSHMAALDTVGTSQPGTIPAVAEDRLPIYLTPPPALVQTAPPAVLGFDAGEETVVTLQTDELVTFGVETAYPGPFHVICDLDQDGVFEFVGDDINLAGISTGNFATVQWNGRDRFGQPVPVGTYQCQAWHVAGEMNLVLEDIETAFPGIRLFRVEPDGSRVPLSMYWDDGLVQGGAVTMLNGQVGLETGGETGLSSGPSSEATTANANSRAWGNFTGAGKGDGTSLVTTTFSAAAFSGGTVTVVLNGASCAGGTGVGKACDDGDACTENDLCSNTVCVGTPKDCDDGNQCTLDSCAGGVCSSAPQAGVSCDDGDVCTINDTCVGALCSGTPDSCDDGNECTADTCDPELGCVSSPLTATGCDDGDLCTTGDTCTNGVCGGAAVTCGAPPSPVCLDATSLEAYASPGICSAETGACDYPAVQVVCLGGCESGVCVGNGCEGQPAGTQCDDSQLCTDNDACDGLGNCVGVLKDCASLDGPCVSGQCQVATGSCVAEAFADGTSCDDGDVCTQSESCSSGACVSTSDLDCDDGDICTTDSCDPSVGCVRANTPNCCTQNSDCPDPGGCLVGVCLENNSCGSESLTGCCSSDPDCDDEDATTNDVCNAQTGTCSNTKIPECSADSECDDGNVCTTDLCAPAGECVHADIPDCCSTDADCSSDQTCNEVNRCDSPTVINVPLEEVVVQGGGNDCTAAAPAAPGSLPLVGLMLLALLIGAGLLGPRARSAVRTSDRQ